MNVKLLSPKEVVDAVIQAYRSNEHSIALNQVEGFVRQVIGWREYMRGIYWMHMPDYEGLNFFNHENKLPEWYWTGETNMKCLSHSIKQSLQFAYAHHIQRLMVTGNFALLAGIHPDEVDSWYLGIYIDALDWVEITNTRGMSQFADGGIVGTKPYVSSANYIDKMSSYCGKCHYNSKQKVGEKACPFNSLYWHFYARNESLLRKNPRIGMMYVTWDKMQPQAKTELLNQAEYYLENINYL
jgi:deoxyribodipyrimidine photolyase-related protein